MRRLLCSVLTTAGLLGAASSAHAVANHKIEAVQKIVKDGKVVGARVHLLVEPQGWGRFRINVAPLNDVPSSRKRPIGDVGKAGYFSGDVVHRQTLAGVRRGYILRTLADEPGGNELKEMHVDIAYDGLDLYAGKKVNLLSSFVFGGFSTATQRVHIFGAWDGPSVRDRVNVIELPGDDATIPEATETLAPPAN